MRFNSMGVEFKMGCDCECKCEKKHEKPDKSKKPEKSKKSKDSKKPEVPKRPDMKDLKYWKITLPDGSERPDVTSSILPFYTNDGAVQIFRCIANSGTTKNTKYSRCEFREMEKDTKASWTTNDSKLMSFSFKVSIKPEKRSRVVIGQIHDAEDDVIILLADFDKGIYEVTHNSIHYGVLIDKLELDTWYDVSVVVGKELITVTTEGKSVKIESKATDCYFKVGNYLQSTEDKDEAVVHVKNLLLV